MLVSIQALSQLLYCLIKLVIIKVRSEKNKHGETTVQRESKVGPRRVRNLSTLFVPMIRTDKDVLRSAEQVCKRGRNNWTMRSAWVGWRYSVEELKTYRKLAATFSLWVRWWKNWSRKKLVQKNEIEMKRWDELNKKIEFAERRLKFWKIWNGNLWNRFWGFWRYSIKNKHGDQNFRLIWNNSLAGLN